jgi:hypothetical protein
MKMIKNVYSVRDCKSGSNTVGMGSVAANADGTQLSSRTNLLCLTPQGQYGLGYRLELRIVA